jgi:hypothetical protein
MPAPRLRRRYRTGSNEYFDRGLKPASLLQHEMLAGVVLGRFASIRQLLREFRLRPQMRTTGACSCGVPKWFAVGHDGPIA